MPFLNGYDTQALLKVDKPVVVDYAGVKERLSRYVCNNCRETYIIKESHHLYCPFCGSQYGVEIDVSIPVDNNQAR
jgi:transposase-like protein